MSKELYNLCRKYKHFYIKNRDVMSWNEKYHDVDLSDAVELTNKQLMKVEDELLIQLFRDMDVHPMSIDISCDAPCRPMNRFGGFLTGLIRHEATVEFDESQRFIKLLGDYMCDYRDKYVI